MRGPGSCGGCGRPLEPGRVCPFCHTRQPLPHRTLRWLALALGTVGLAALLLYHRGRDPHAVCVTAITPRMHHATVRVTVDVTHQPYTAPAGDYASLRVAGQDDAPLRIQAYGTAVEVLQTPRAPAVGDRVQATGVLRLAAGREPRLILRRPEDLQILEPDERPSPPAP